MSSRRTALLWIAVVVAVVLTAAPPAVADDPATPPAAPSAPRLMVVGDSISSTSRYGEATTGGKVKAWWAYLADRIKAAPHPTVSAQPGSGMLKRGRVGGTFAEGDDPDARCTGGTFGSRLPAIAAAAPDVLVVEGGRNDFKICRRDGTSRTATSQETRTGVSRYLAALRRTTDAAGMDPRNVYVVTVWGTSYGRYRDIVTSYVERYAVANGFTYVPVPVLGDRYTYDGTHPNSRGTAKIASMIVQASDIVRRARPTASDPRVTPIHAYCVGLRDCGTTYGKVAYGAVRARSFWRQTPEAGGTNYVAYRLDRRGNPRLDGRTAVAWRLSARQEGLPISGVPTPGSIAWWPRNPNDGSAKGHVAYVVKVRNGSVTVFEELAGHRYRVTRYAGGAYPRGFITFPR